MPHYHVPSIVALAVWGASALAVLGFTARAFKETAPGR